MSETGSTLLLPLVSSWQVAYTTLNPKVLITTSGTGSGTGIADAAAGTVNIGGSDAYLSPADISQYPGLLNIPLSVAALVVNYNLPGVKTPLKLNGTVLAEIYSGKITTWNDAAITALNPGVTLPSTKIVTLHRADSSGSTFLFTSYLNAQDPSGWSSSNVGTTVSWPSVPGAEAETGSGAMVKGCGAIKGCIAYIGISYRAQAQAAGLGEAALANKGGQVRARQLPTSAARWPPSPARPRPSGAQSLINGVQRLPDHQLRVRDREDEAALDGRGVRGEGLPDLGHHLGQLLEVPDSGQLRAAAVQRGDHRESADRQDSLSHGLFCTSGAGRGGGVAASPPAGLRAATVVP